MTRKDLEKLWPILEAYRQGKTIEVCDSYKDTWRKIDNPVFDSDPDHYRIAAEPKYRPFQNSEECWEEMKKHRPFGWIKNSVDFYKGIRGVRQDAILFSLDPIIHLDFQPAFNKYTFADGTPFGIKQEEWLWNIG